MSYLIQLRNDTAANWTSVNPILAAGEAGFEIDTGIFKIGNGTSTWTALAATAGVPAPVTPAGIISQFAGSTAPSGYLLCQGQTLSTTTYANLFSAIGYTYGGGGSDFKVPDLQSRIPVGKGPDTEFDALGETGGAKSVTLTSAQIPAHSHPNTLSSNTVAAAGHTHSHISPFGLNSGSVIGLGPQNPAMNNMGLGTYQFAGSIQGNAPSINFGGGSIAHEVWSVTSSGNSANTTVGISNANNTGGDGAHTNLQPYIVVNYIIKT
jgi:microcystin-dependent protein